VESYLSNAMAKLGARSRTEAISLAMQQGILVHG
jgi:DNA-binding CsgD family transcriptional regulator